VEFAAVAGGDRQVEPRRHRLFPRNYPRSDIGQEFDDAGRERGRCGRGEEDLYTRVRGERRQHVEEPRGGGHGVGDSQRGAAYGQRRPDGRVISDRDP
jgi:hypothetical protein